MWANAVVIIAGDNTYLHPVILAVMAANIAVLHPLIYGLDWRPRTSTDFRPNAYVWLGQTVTLAANVVVALYRDRDSLVIDNGISVGL